MSESVLELLTSGGRASSTQLQRATEVLKGGGANSPLQETALLLDRGIVSRDEADDLLRAVAARRRPSQPPPDLTGRIFGKFRLSRVLSRGVASITYVGDHPLGTQASVRVFTRPGLEERLLAEATRLAKIDHPNLARVHDFGVEDGLCYVASTFVDGSSFEALALLPDPSHLAKSGPWLRQLAAGLRTLHAAGLVHGQISPGTVIVGSDGQAHLVEFPMSVGEPEDLLLASIEGTPTFAAPERLKGFEPEPRSDLYSLAATFYWLIGREAPLAAPTYAGLLLRRSLGKPTPDALLRAGADPTIVSSLIRLLDPNPAARFADATAFLASLPAPGAAAPAPAPAPASAPPTSPKTAPPPPSTRRLTVPKQAVKPVRESPVHNLVIFSAAVLVLLGVTLGLVIHWKTRREPPKGGPPVSVTPAAPDPLPLPPNEGAEERRRLVEEGARAQKAGDLQKAAQLYREAEKIEKSAELTRLIMDVENQLRGQAREKADFEQLERTLTALPSADAALHACDEFLRRYPSSSYTERVLALKQELMKSIEPEKPPKKPDPHPKPTEAGRPLRAEVREALLWLARHQNTDGIWSAVKFVDRCAANDLCTPNPGSDNYAMGVSALALLAMLGAGIGFNDQDTYDGINLGETVRRGVEAIAASVVIDGVIGGGRRPKTMYTHALGTHVLAEALRSIPPEPPVAIREKARALRTALQECVDYLVRAQNPGRGWRYTERSKDNDSSVTAVVLMALEAARRAGIVIPPDAIKGGLTWFQEAQDGTGRIGYDARGTRQVVVPGQNEEFKDHETLTAAAVTCRLLLARDRVDPMKETMLQLVAKDRAGPGALLDYYACYWTARAWKESGDPRWESAKEPLILTLAPLQSRDPRCRRGSFEPTDRWSGEGGRVYATAIAALVMELIYQPQLFDFTGVAQRDGPPPPPPQPVPDPTPVPKPAPPAGPSWIFVLKSGGQLRVQSYQEVGERYHLKLFPSGESKLPKEDVLRIQKSGSKP
jgi:serine/threonine-protein kinase